jgi:7-carboxy-7-deazaguanine synthase
MRLLVTELFYSVQGESLWAGLPCGFIRLSGCNLRCRYCDTQYAYEPGDPMKIDDILEQVGRFDCPHVTVTGGEPLHQNDTPKLISRLIQKGYRVNLETNGSLDIGSVDPLCIKVMDLKCPSSGMQAHNNMANLRHLGPKDQVKFVIANQEDYQFALMMANRLTSHMDSDRILFSPVHGRLSAPDLARWMLRDRARARLQIQLHRYLWPDEIRGV